MLYRGDGKSKPRSTVGVQRDGEKTSFKSIALKFLKHQTSVGVSVDPNPSAPLYMGTAGTGCA